MERIICDSYIKKDKHIFGDDRSSPFNQRILAVNDMFGWLYEKGILEKASMEFMDYEDAAFFALDANELLPYRAEMEKSGLSGAGLAVRHIFDEPYTPCTYSGAIELTWMMASYRNVDGCVGRSWECDLIKNLDTTGIYCVSEVRDTQGVKAAMKTLFGQFDWDLTVAEQKVYQEALNYYAEDANGIEHIEGISERNLIYCYEHEKDLMDFDFWCQYEVLCGHKLSYDEYLAIDIDFDGDPFDVAESDHDTIARFRESLSDYRSSLGQDPSSPFAKLLWDIKSQLKNEENESDYGEPQAFVELDNGRTIEVTLEQEMLESEDYFYSLRLMCNESEFDNHDFNKTNGVIDSYTSTGSNRKEIGQLLKLALACNEKYPVADHSRASEPPAMQRTSKIPLEERIKAALTHKKDTINKEVEPER